MGLVANYAGAILLRAPPMPRTLAVHARPPIRELLRVALCAQLPRIFEVDGRAIREVEQANVVGIMAMQTPYIAVDHFILFVFIFEFADFTVNRSIRVTVHAWHVLVVDFGCST